jgi:hypothetical protein
MRAHRLMTVFLFGALVATGQGADDPPKQPPEGWKEYVSPTKAFSVWLPKGGKRSERNRDVTYGKAKLKLSLVQQETDDKAVYAAGQVALPVPAGKQVDPNAAIEVFRDGFVKDQGGKILDENEIKLGKMAGKEYLIQLDGDKKATLRLYCTGPRVYQIALIGTKAQVEGESAKIFFDSFKHQGMVKDDENKTVATVPIAKTPTIVAGGAAPVFKEVAPDGGLLIGLEIGLGKFGKDDVIKSVRPIYRAGGKDHLGQQRGTPPTPAVTVKAKDGYAIAAVTCKSGLNFDGCSLTFMKMKADGTLDPADSYESDWVGYNGNKRPTKLGGDGTPVIGIVGRGTDRELNGLGLLFKGQEGFEPKN